jgi:hypothetical protein
MVVARESHNEADPGNPVTSVRHVTAHATKACLGCAVWIFCPGCQALHMPRFRCPEHGGPKKGPVWDGDPNSNPFTMSPSLLIYETAASPRCHSFIRNGQWQYLHDCTHLLRGKTVPLEPLPNWLIRDTREE